MKLLKFTQIPYFSGRVKNIFLILNKKMRLLEKILVPVNVNTNSEEQINTTIKIAGEYKSEVILLSVIPDENLNSEIKDFVESVVTESLTELRNILINNNIYVREPVLAYGKPVDNIIQTANSENVNLILVGNNKKKKNGRNNLGIKAEQLIRMSDIPVCVVNAGEETRFTNIMCPVDFSEPSKRALYNSILLSRKFQSTLNILYVYEPITYISKRIDSDIDEENALRFKKAKSLMKEFIKDFDLSGINHSVKIKKGIAHEKILNTIKKEGITLLIMGTNGRVGLSKFFLGSVTEKVTIEMPCPFITTKTQDIFQLQLDNEIREIEIHFKNGIELTESGFYKEAINQFRICLQINDMHIPTLYKLAELYKITGDLTSSDYFKNKAKEILTKLWDKKIEMEIRKHYIFKK
jgi:universal stress protein E